MNIKFYPGSTVHFSIRYTIKIQFSFRRFHISFVFSRPATVLNLDLFTVVTEYAMAWKATREIRSGESFGRATVKLNIRKFGVPVGCLFSATPKDEVSTTIKSGFSSHVNPKIELRWTFIKLRKTRQTKCFTYNKFMYGNEDLYVHFMYTLYINSRPQMLTRLEKMK